MSHVMMATQQNGLTLKSSHEASRSTSGRAARVLLLPFPYMSETFISSDQIASAPLSQAFSPELAACGLRYFDALCIEVSECFRWIGV
jgi:hypothetical protein